MVSYQLQEIFLLLILILQKKLALINATRLPVICPGEIEFPTLKKHLKLQEKYKKEC